MNANQWKDRLAFRSDLTGYVTHLTRSKTEHSQKLTSLDILCKILMEQRLEGSRPGPAFLKGLRQAVCFQDVPLHAIAQNVHFEEQNGLKNSNGKERYSREGLMFSKRYVYEKGGRPVLYLDSASGIQGRIPEKEKWRVVELALSQEKAIVDWTHEREWRVPDHFQFNLSEAIVIVADTRTYREFVTTFKGNIGDLAGIITLSAVLG